jgi:sulfotransferase
LAPHIVFLAGLPRSGSTLLANLACQNPILHATPTSGLAGVVEGYRTFWSTDALIRAQGIENVRPKFLSSLEGLILGWHKREIQAGKIVLDKNRVWPRHIELLEMALGQRVTVLFPIRDVRDILTSFEKLHRKDLAFKPRPYNETPVARAESWLHPEHGAVGRAISIYRDAIARGVDDRIWTLRYNDLCSHPQDMMDAVHEVIGIPPFAYDVDNVQQFTYEDDAVHGITGLHDIRARIQPQPSEWQQFLPQQYGQALEARYADVMSLVQA